jgi:hypothetical protein
VLSELLENFKGVCSFGIGEGKKASGWKLRDVIERRASSTAAVSPSVFGSLVVLVLALDWTGGLEYDNTNFECD